VKAEVEVFALRAGAFASTLDSFNLNLNLDIHLTFACLRETAPAKAGILKFGIRTHFGALRLLGY